MLSKSVFPKSVILGLFLALIGMTVPSTLTAQGQVSPALLDFEHKEITRENQNFFQFLLQSSDKKTFMAAIQLARRRPSDRYRKCLEYFAHKTTDPELKSLCETAIEEMKQSLVPQVSGMDSVMQVHSVETEALLDYRVLNFGGSRLEEVDFAKIPTQHNLRFLMLPDGVTDEHLSAIGKCQTLETLLVGKGNVSKKGIAELIPLGSLTTLDLSQCQALTGDCAIPLAQMPKLEKLFLPLGITEPGLRTLADGLANLKVLMLTGDLAEDMLKLLTTKPSMETVILIDSPLSEAAVQNLRDANRKILWVTHRRSKP